MSTLPPISILPAVGAPPEARVPGRRTKPALVLGGKDQQSPAWWVDPLRAILFLVVPLFCFASYLNRFNYRAFGASENFVTAKTFGLGIYSAGLLLLGIVVGHLALRRQDMVSLIDAERAQRVLVRLGWITIIAYVLLLGALVTQASLVLELLRGSASAPTRLREALGRIPGITSFVQFNIVYLALASALVTMAGFRMTTRLWVMTGAILVLTFLRAILASERLALLEALAAIFVIPVAYLWRPSVWRSLAPFLGAVFVFAAFAAGEYFRSWQYYRQFYDSYLTFVVQRFAGYFSTSINNGAGTYYLYGQHHPTPEITVGWVTRFPGFARLFPPPKISMLDQYLTTFANPEFNNPGGFYAAFLDYRFGIATVFMLSVGLVVGLVHRSFQNRSLLGLILYPAVFLGLTDLIRIMYVSDTRMLPIVLGAIVTAFAVRPVQLPRHRFLTQMKQARSRT